MSEWAGKVALVTGGTSGIGRETAVLFATRGAKVVVAGRREAEGNAAVESIRSNGGEGLFVKTDVAIAADVKAWSRRRSRNLVDWISSSIMPALKANGFRLSSNPRRIGTGPSPST